MIVAVKLGIPIPKFKINWNHRISKQVSPQPLPKPSPTQRKIPPRLLQPEANSAATKAVGIKKQIAPIAKYVTDASP